MTALGLRVLACIFMLVDHVGLMLGSYAFRAVGRMAFPIFVFLIYNGYCHTSHRGRYALRLGLFAILSQMPYCLFLGYGFWERGNVFFTLLAALLCLWAVDAMRQHSVLRWFCWLPVLAGVSVYVFGWFASDYAATGILLVLVFYLFDRKTVSSRILTVIGSFVAMYYRSFVSVGIPLLLGRGWHWPAMGTWDVLRLFSLLSLVFIFLYNGKKGWEFTHPKVVQIGFYLFYPVHQIVLWAIGQG